jgi:RP/EB family microtubule-associated protein
MDPAYFVGKNELLAWLNELLKLNYSKVEQCNTGAAYCQIIDAVYPVTEESTFLHFLYISTSDSHVPQGEVPLKKVNFNAKTEPEYIKNFKVLQTTFDKKQISRVSSMHF